MGCRKVRMAGPHVPAVRSFSNASVPEAVTGVPA